MLRLESSVEDVHHEVTSQAAQLPPRQLGVLHKRCDVGPYYEMDHRNTHCLASVDVLLQ